MYTADWKQARRGRGRLTLQGLIHYPTDEGMTIIKIYYAKSVNFFKTGILQENGGVD